MKLGLYICEGCQITDNINVQALADLAENEYDISICRKHLALCSGEGVKLINKDIEQENLKGVIIAACSPRYNTSVFNFKSDIIKEKGDLTFVLSDDKDFTEEEKELLKQKTEFDLCLSPNILHTEHCIVLVHNIFDRFKTD